MPITSSFRTVVKIAGESGQGVNSVGEIVAKSLKESGYHQFGYREYPSLIKGGYSCYQIDIADRPIKSSSQYTNLLLCLSRVSVHAYLKTLAPQGQLVHSLPALSFSADERAFIEQNQIAVEYVDAAKLALAVGGKAIMANTVIIGILLQLYGLSEQVVGRVLKEEFANKPEMLAANLACLQAGHEYQLQTVKKPTLPTERDASLDNAYLLTGNHALALGAVSAGVRAYYAYPMTPASSILTYLSQWYHQTGMLVRQVDDEISVAQMAIGSMYVGTRALVGTSGGGFDLMTESVSLAAMTETPFVCILGQRPGPATGLPTWTATGDLNLAVYAGHGEFARLVVAASDVESCYTLVQHAFNYAEKYQTAVIVLTEKEIAESLYCVTSLPAAVPIERHLLPDEELEKITPAARYDTSSPSGVSPRWLPGSSPAVFDTNGDEHLADGSLTEESQPVKAMYDKRMRKQAALLAELPEPALFGDQQPDVVLVGWGSVKNAVLDALPELSAAFPEAKIGYLHYEYVYPVRTERLQQLHQAGAKLVLIENNYLGQLGGLITQHTAIQFPTKLLKYDGRPFFVEDVVAGMTPVLTAGRTK